MRSTPSVLFVGGVPRETALLIDELQREGCVGHAEHVENVTALAGALDHPVWDAVVVDGEAPGLDLAQALDLLRARDLNAALLVMSRDGGSDATVRVIAAAAPRRAADADLDCVGRRNLREVLAGLPHQDTRFMPLQSYELLEQMFANVHLAIALMDPHFTFVRVNRAYALAGKHDPEWFVGKNHFELYPNEENETLFRQVLETHKPMTVFAQPFVYPDQPERGTTYWDWTLQSFHDPSGRIGGLILTLLDVTERERARQAADEERQRVYSILNKLPGFIGINSPIDHRIHFLNEASQACFGDPAGRPCYEVLTARDAPCRICGPRLVLTDGKPREWDWTSADGRVYRVWGFPFSEAGRSDRVLQFGIDVTRQREIENELLTIATGEQERAGQDLHDSLGQSMSGAAMLSKALAQRLAAAGSPESKTALELHKVVAGAVRQTQALVRGLCPVRLDERGLQEALRRLANETERCQGVPCMLESRGDVVVQDTTVASHLYQIARDAVRAAVRRTPPDSIVIYLRSGGNQVTLTIETEGGSAVEMDDDLKGTEIRRMKHRAWLIGGRLDLDADTKGGTIVTCVVPEARAADRPN
ncbi:MAG: PAS domain-containing protein [Verrucomicrobia bacterium]|nr:PAS domain-containing protein [Verrucomicrobiota bacterium]